MIPTSAEDLAGYAFVARRLRLEGRASDIAVRAALAGAAKLATVAADEPAAMVSAFARYRRAFPGAMRDMAAILAFNQASAIGLRLHASGAELHDLFGRFMLERVPFDGVRTWFAARLSPAPSK